MELRQLATFECVARHRNFTKAAEELSIAQPAVSQQIASLEQTLGVKLFTRGKGGVALTAAGQVLLGYAQRLRLLASEASDRTRRADRGEIGNLSIGFLGSAAGPLLPELLQRYRQKYPGISVNLTEMTPTLQWDAFERGDLDLGFNRPMPSRYRDDYEEWVLYYDELVLAVPESDPNVGARSVSLLEYANAPFVMFARDQGPDLVARMHKLAEEEEMALNVVGESPVMYSVLTLVAAGMGYSIVPACVQFLRVDGVEFLTLNNGRPDLPLTVVHRKRHHSPALEGMLSELRESAPKIQERFCALLKRNRGLTPTGDHEQTSS